MSAEDWKDTELVKQIQVNYDFAASLPGQAAVWKACAAPYVDELRRRAAIHPDGTAAWYLSTLRRRLAA